MKFITLQSTDERYPKRRHAKKSYKEDEISSEEEFIVCYDCNQEYSGPCPTHGALTLIENIKIPKDGTVTERAKKTLPKFLSLCPSNIEKAGLGVWTEAPLPPRLVFGPYEGKMVRKPRKACKSGYSWKIRKDGKTHYYVEAAEEEVSNWLRFVNCAESFEQQNLVAFQHKRKIYYRTYKHIPAHTELLIWYGDDYAKDLGIDLTPTELAESVSKELQHHECEICHNLFADPGTLQGHQKSHPHMVPDRRHQCHLCPYSSNKKTSLKKHMLTHTGDRPYPCHLCEKTFARKDHRKRHLCIHTGERLHLCISCGMTFNQFSHLKRHWRSHSLDKPYVCSVCGNGFRVSSNLREHERMHTGQKPYRCQHCNRRFVRSSHMEKHIKYEHASSNASGGVSRKFIF